MTDTTSAAPSDAEIGDLCDQFRWDTAEGRRACARAVLAKWGTPTPPAVVPIGWYVTGCSRILDEHDAKAEARQIGGSAKALPLCTAPAVAEPLTDGLVQQHHRDSRELRSLCAARDQARGERDALRAEIAGLEASCSTLGRLVDELRPDAERLEWVLRRCAGSWLRAYLGTVSDTSDMDTLRTLIDANRGALPAHGIGIGNGEHHE